MANPATVVSSVCKPFISNGSLNWMLASRIWLGAGSTNVGTENNRQLSSQSTTKPSVTSQGRACFMIVWFIAT